MHKTDEALVIRPELTKAQRAALRWFYNRGGDGMFNKGQVMLARGELAAVERKTWNALAKAEPPLITYSTGKGYKRATLTDAGKAVALTYAGKEADTVEDDYDA